MAIPVTERAPRPESEQRRHLHVVATPQRRRAQARLMALLLALFVCASLFGVVAFHVLLNQGQDGLDGLQARVAAAQAREQRLRLEVAALQSPVRIVDVARERLGMVPPAAIAYVTPGTSGSAIAAPATVPAPPLPPTASPLPTEGVAGARVAASVAPASKSPPRP